MDLEEYIEKLAQVRDGLDEKIHEAHQLHREVKETTKEMQKYVDNAQKDLEKQMDEKMEKFMEDFTKSTTEAIQKSEAAIYRRFDKLVDTLLGEGRKSRESLAQLMESAAKNEASIKQAYLETALNETVGTVKSKRRRTMETGPTELPPGLRKKR